MGNFWTGLPTIWRRPEFTIPQLTLPWNERFAHFTRHGVIAPSMFYPTDWDYIYDYHWEIHRLEILADPRTPSHVA
jgi:hypothetical protein